MKEINYSYTLTKEIVRKGINLSGMYKITKSKKIIFSILCLFIIVNSAYAMISTGEFHFLHLIYIIFGVGILGYVWLLPNFIINRKITTTQEGKIIEIIAKPSQLIISENGEEKQTITARDYRGYVKGEDMFVVYHSTTYTSLPTENLEDEQKAELEELLKYFHNPDYFKSEEKSENDNEPEFPAFVPPEDFVSQEENPITIENEEAKNE